MLVPIFSSCTRPSSQSVETCSCLAMAAMVSARGRRSLDGDRSCDRVERSSPALAAKPERLRPERAITSERRSRKVSTVRRRSMALGRGLVIYRNNDDYPHIIRSEEHTYELQSLMRISYAVFCLKKK